MAVRRRALQPDAVLETQSYGAIPYVSDQAFLEASLAFAQTQAIAGGVVTSIVDRHPTDLDGESVTVAAVLEWKSRTDARPAREPVTAPRASIVDDIHEEPVETEPLPEISDDQLTIDPETDPEREPEEDLSSIPVEMR
jgi:hypothetical protein